MGELKPVSNDQAPISINISADPTVNYAVQQNAVSVIKRLRITNMGSADLDQSTVSIITEPPFAHRWELSLDRIPSGATSDLGAVDLPLSHDFLARQAEAVRGSIAVTIRRGEEVLCAHRTPIDILAYDQWNGTRAIPEILAAFVMPNHPAVEQTLRQAGEHLRSWTGTPSFHGYQRTSAEQVMRQAAAIYTAIQELEITYCGVPASFEQDGQKIRTPDRVLDTRLGNCLDLSALFAACLEQSGLHPLICLIKGHAFPGVWLTEESFADTVIDDALTLRKRVDLGEISVFESTKAVAGSTAAFTSAVADGRRHLDNPNQFVFCLDVRRARMSRIRPLPLRSGAGLSTLDDTSAAMPVGTESPVPSPSASTPPTPAPRTEQPTPAPVSRLDRWKRKLLDLSLRNRLLNFQETRSAVPLLFPNLPTLENALAEGKQLELHAQPHDWQGALRDRNVHWRRTGEDAERALLLEEIDHRRLRCELENAELTRRLTEIFRSARSSLEENGANTLYLALGMLVWYESKSSTQPRRAPIILLPVELQRRGAQSGFILRRRDEEPMVNVTLLELLRHDFSLHIDGLDPLPEDEAGTDVRLVLDRVRQAVKHIDRWDVVEDAYLGLFSFTKFLMWRDLEVRTEDLKRNQLVSSLIHFPTEPFPAASGFPEPARLDDDYRPDETFTPVSSDSSQLAAVYAAAEGKSFVLHGPPGTGKSQTITNIIAHALAQGKTVLFVAEKMAALSVVQRRLESVGLGPFCLELHSNKSRKADVLAQLDTSLRFANVKSSAEWRLQSERLAEARRELNTFVRTLHRPRHTGESFYSGLSRLIALGAGPRVQLDPQLIGSATAADLERLRDKVRSLAAAGRAVGDPYQNVWRAVGCQEWTPRLRDDVDTAIVRLADALRPLVDSAQQVAPLLGLPAGGWSWAELIILKRLAELIVPRASFPAPLIAASDWEEVQGAIRQWIRLGRERDSLRRELYSRYTDRILQLDLDELTAQLAAAAQAWFLPRWLIRRRVAKLLQTARKPGQKVMAAELEADVDLAWQVRHKEQFLAASSERARTLLGLLWNDGEANWDEIAGACDWAGSVRGLAAQLGAGDALRTQEMRRHWATLLSEQAELLRSDGLHAQKLQRLVYTITAVEAECRLLVSLLSLDEPVAWGHQTEPRCVERLTDILSGWQNQTGQLRLWCAWMKERSEALALKLGPLVEAYEEGRFGNAELTQAFERSFCHGWVGQIMGQEDELRRFSRQSVEDRVARFRALDDRISQLTRQEIQARLSARIPRFEGEVSQSSEVGILRRELQKRTRHMALRALFQNIRNLLPRLKPCLLMSPISVAQYLDPAFPPFDLVVFDEASQVPTWDAVGAVARGAQTVIVGDPKQLPPTNFFAKTEDTEEDEVATEDLESILDDTLALTVPEMHLRWHYRSQHESLIAFSNYHYYKKGLVSFPSPVDRSAVTMRYLKGEYDRSISRTNRVEAEAVVQEVVNRLRNAESAQQSLGIVTFSMAQQRLVEDLLDEARRRYPEIEPHFSGDLQEPVFVKNLENVQGDERDVILFSVCYGPNSQGRISMHFGPLNREGGERRLNVAVTRARREVVVFTSLLPDQIDLSRTKAQGVHHLRAFLEYAQRGLQVLKEQVRFGDQSGEDSLFEQHLYEVLTARGYRVQRQVGSSDYRMDLAIEDPSSQGRFLLGIQCDGATYSNAHTARDRDKLRETVLRGLGWRLHRVWGTDWWHDGEGALQRLEEAIQAARTDTELGASHPAISSAAPDEEPATIAAAASEPAQPVATPAPSPPTYRPSGAQPSAEATQSDLFSPAVELHIQQLLAAVVAEEGPLSLGLLCQRVAPWWGINRVTARVEARISNLARHAGIVRIIHGEVAFLWPSGLNPETYTGFRVPAGDEKSRRDADDLPPEEIANAALSTLQGQISLPLDDLVREVARLFGYQRIGQNVDRCLRSGIALLLSRGAAEDRDGLVVVRAR